MYTILLKYYIFEWWVETVVWILASIVYLKIDKYCLWINKLATCYVPPSMNLSNLPQMHEFFEFSCCSKIFFTSNSVLMNWYSPDERSTRQSSPLWPGNSCWDVKCKGNYTNPTVWQNHSITWSFVVAQFGLCQDLKVILWLLNESWLW